MSFKLAKVQRNNYFASRQSMAGKKKRIIVYIHSWPTYEFVIYLY